MITAKLKDNIINCYDNKYTKETLKKWAEKNILLCPICNKPYEYCHGKVVSPYFRHKEKQECDYLYNEPETEEHIKGKIALYEWIQTQEGVSDIILEGWIPETKQRPDIMFKYNNKQYVIEYQCTPISSEYLERHELYQAGGINDIWILGTEKYIKNRNRKHIEKYNYIYFDSKVNQFIFNRDYYNISNFISNDYIKIIGVSYYCTNSNNVIFENNKIFICNNIIEEIQDKYFKLEKAINDKNNLIYSLINKSINILKDKYSTINLSNYSSFDIELDNFLIKFKKNDKILFVKKYFSKDNYKVWNGKKMANRFKWTYHERNISELNYDYNNFDTIILLDFVDVSLNYYETIKYFNNTEIINYNDLIKIRFESGELK